MRPLRYHKKAKEFNHENFRDGSETCDLLITIANQRSSLTKTSNRGVKPASQTSNLWITIAYSNMQHVNYLEQQTCDLSIIMFNCKLSKTCNNYFFTLRVLVFFSIFWQFEFQAYC